MVERIGRFEHYIASTYKKKSEADKEAQSRRDKGHRAKVFRISLPEGYSYCVYSTTNKHERSNIMRKKISKKIAEQKTQVFKGTKAEGRAKYWAKLIRQQNGKASVKKEYGGYRVYYNF